MARRSRIAIVRRSLVLGAMASLVIALVPDAWAGRGGPAAGGDQLWLARFNGPGNGDDAAHAMQVSPDGSVVFVTGYATGATSGHDYATVAYDAGTGVQLWAARYAGPGTSTDEASALGLSPDGSVVFVTGFSGESNLDFATVAYNAATGARLWVARFDGPAHGGDLAHALGVSPDGSTVFVTGESAARDVDYATIAYDATTGARLWVARYAGPGVGFWDIPHALGVSGDGSRVFVTGASTEGGGASYFDFATIAYDATTGARLWVARFDGHVGDDVAYALGVSPDGSAVYVTGYTDLGSDYATIAYDAVTGSRLWRARYDGPNHVDVALALAVSPDGSAVFVTGRSGEYGSADYATVAYDATTGSRRWDAAYAGPANDEDVALAMGVSPDSATVFVTGYSDQAYGLASNKDYATVAYDAVTGGQVWEATYASPGTDDDIAFALGVSPVGSAVFVTGQSGGYGNLDAVTIAYAP